MKMMTSELAKIINALVQINDFICEDKMYQAGYFLSKFKEDLERQVEENEHR